MKRILLAAVGLTATALVPSPAFAAFGSDTINGGCSFDTNANATATGGQNVGEISDLSITTDSTGAPTFATVSCWIDVNGVEAPGTRLTASGNGVQAGATTISFSDGGGTLPSALCQEVVYADGTTDYDCGGGPERQIPPQSILDLITAAQVDYVDPVVCPVLRQLVGSYPGGVTIAPDGDLYLPDPFGLDINPFWDCPPYATEGGQGQ